MLQPPADNNGGLINFTLVNRISIHKKEKKRVCQVDHNHVIKRKVKMKVYIVDTCSRLYLLFLCIFWKITHCSSSLFELSIFELNFSYVSCGFLFYKQSRINSVLSSYLRLNCNISPPLLSRWVFYQALNTREDLDKEKLKLSD